MMLDLLSEYWYKQYKEKTFAKRYQSYKIVVPVINGIHHNRHRPALGVGGRLIALRLSGMTAALQASQEIRKGS
jgi:hypothetical protein